MRRAFHKAYTALDAHPYKDTIIVAIACAFIGMRICFEIAQSLPRGVSLRTEIIGVALTASWLFLWYSASFAIWLLCFRHIAQAPLRSVAYVLFGTAGLLIPLIDVAFSGTNTNFTFLSYSDPKSLAASILTLMYLSHDNYYMFKEFLVMGIGIGAAAYFFSRSIVRSVLTPLAVYLLLVFAQAFVYLCRQPFCVIKVQSGIPGELYFCCYFAVVLCVWICIFLWPELRAYARSSGSAFSKWHAARILPAIIACAGANLLITRHFFDLLFMTLAEAILIYLLVFLAQQRNNQRLTALNLFFALCVLSLMSAFFSPLLIFLIR